MTAQIQNVMFFNNQKYTIVAQQNELDFRPEQYGINPHKGCSMCWRGYFCKFGILDNQLVIMDWHILVEDESEPPVVENIHAINSYGKWQYVAMNIPLDYSGGIIIGSGFIDKYYIHMGFQQVYAFKTVYELIFDKGILTRTYDHSERLEQLRQNIDEKHDDLKDQMIGNIPKFFSMRYEEKWNAFK